MASSSSSITPSIPRLSSSVDSSCEPSPQTEFSAPLFVHPDMLFSPSRKRPSHLHEGVQGGMLSAQLPTERNFLQHQSPPSSPVYSPSPSARKRTLEAQSLMRSKYHPYRQRTAFPPLELRFTARTMGRSSHSDIALEDVYEGHDILCCGLSQLSNKVLVKAIQAKHVFRDCILQRVTQTKAEIESTERYRDLLSEICAEHQDALATAEAQLALMRQIFDGRDLQDTKDDVAYYHAIYADELVAFTIADAQADQMNRFAAEERSLGHESDGDSNASSPSHSDTNGGVTDEEPFTGLLSSDDNAFDD